MPVEVLWAIGTGEYDGYYPWQREQRWRPNIDRIQQAAMAVDSLPYSGALLAIGLGGTFDAWIAAAAVARATRRMRFLIAVNPGLISPTQLALMALTFDHATGGRLALNVVGSNPSAMAAHGVHIAKEERYELLREYWEAFCALYAGKPVPPGRHYDIRDPESFLGLAPIQDPHPPLFGAGSSPEGLDAVLSLVDTYLAVAGTPDEVAARTAVAADAALRLTGVVPRFAISVGVLVRETEEEAWAEAERRLRHTSVDWVRAQMGWQIADLDAETLDDRQRRCRDAISEGRLPAARDLEFYPNLWTGPIDRAGLDFTRTTPLPTTMLIGSATQVAERISEFQEKADVDRFILWSPPFAEEAYRVADTLLPILDLTSELAVPSSPLREGVGLA